MQSYIEQSKKAVAIKSIEIYDLDLSGVKHQVCLFKMAYIQIYWYKLYCKRSFQQIRWGLILNRINLFLLDFHSMIVKYRTVCLT